MRLETFGQSSESDNTKKGKDIIRRKAEELLNIGSRQSDDKSTSSTANDQFLAEITKGAIDSLERRGFFEKTGMQRLFGRKLTENRLPDDLMSKAKEHIKSIIKGVARNPQMLTQQQKDFISSFLAVDVYSNKAKSLSIHRNLEKFAKGLRDASAAFIAHSEVQDNLLGITKDSSGKITVDLYSGR